MTSGPQLTNSLLRRAGPPGRGIFVLEISLMPPSPESLPKNGFCPKKGVAFLTEGIFEKKFQVRESAPHVTRVAVLRDATTQQGIGLFAVIRGHCLGARPSPIGLREIERGITTFVREGDGGLIVMASGSFIAL